MLFYRKTPGFLTPAFRLDLWTSHFRTGRRPAQPWPRMDVRELLVLPRQTDLGSEFTSRARAARGLERPPRPRGRCRRHVQTGNARRCLMKPHRRITHCPGMPPPMLPPIFLRRAFTEVPTLATSLVALLQLPDTLL